ncbi:MAG: photosystem I assembly protein Ycf3 [Elusimicrobia bacterium ADurb.Bin231]|nr:MAG: photosystem I assembly protein Ycf3 [Elusimicrobia bacterium ADurb.Bin231]
MGKKIIDVCRKTMLYFTPVFYFLMAVAFYLKTYDSCQIKITIFQIGCTILVSAFLIKWLETWENPFPEGSFYLLLPVLLCLASGIFSFSISPLKNWFGTMDEFTRRAGYIFIFFIILSEFRTEKDQKRLVNWFLAGAFVAVFYGIIQFLDGFYPPSPAPGLDPFIWRQAFGKRIFSTFGNPNFFGDFLLVVAPVILSFVFIKFSKFMILFYVLTVMCIIFTYSKAVWIGYSAGVMAFSFFAVAFLSHGKKETIRKILFGMSVAVFAAMVIGVLLLTMQRVDSVRFRTSTWLGTWEMINRTPHPDSFLYDRSPLKWKSSVRKAIHPLIGSGIGSFKAVYPAYRRPEIIQLEGRSNTESDHPENEFIEVIYDEGIIGFGFFILLIITFLMTTVKRLQTIPSDKKFVIHGLIGFASGMISQLTHNFMCVSMRFVSEGVIFWLCLGMMGVLSLPQIPSYVSSDAHPDKKKPFYVGALQAVVAVGCVYFVIYFWGFFRADIHHNIAIYHSKRGDWNSALKNYETVLKYNPDYVMTHYFMGNVYNDRWGDGDADRAIGKYQDVLKIAPNYVQIFMQIGTIYAKKGDWENAIKYYKMYQRLDPIFERSYQSLGFAYTQLKSWKEAENTYKRYIARNDWYYYYLYLVNKKDEDYRAALKYHMKADPWLNLGNVYFAEKKYFAAENAYRKVLKDIDPGNASALKNLAVIYNATGRTQQAQRILQMLSAGGNR